MTDSTTKESITRSVKEIEEQIEKRKQLRDQKLAQAEELSAKIPSTTDEGALLLAAHDGEAQAKKRLEEIDQTRQALEKCKKIMAAVDHQLAEDLGPELKQAMLREFLEQKNKLFKLNKSIEAQIKGHLREAEKLYEGEWEPRAREIYSLQMKLGTRGPTPKAEAFNWIRGHFGHLLYPLIEFPPQPRTENPQK